MNKIIELLKGGNIVIPMIFLNNYQKLELTEKEFILLSYLMNYNGSFNPKQIGINIGYSFKDVLELIDTLSHKGFLEIEVKNINNMKEEFINLDKLYSKLSFLVMNKEEEEEKPSNLFSVFEKEFGRTLSPIEYELVMAWKDNNIDEELIKEALKEAVLNSALNLRYIDRILYEWNKKGIKKVSDIKKKNEPVQGKKVDVFEYDWLNEE